LTIFTFGLNFRTAPVEVRERLVVSGSTLSSMLRTMRQEHELGSLDEVVILSTCNRLEVYGASDEGAEIAGRVAGFLAHAGNVTQDEILAHAWQAYCEDAVEHLMRVACGLDSMILGEAQILGQVTDAYEAAHAAGSTGPLLSRLFLQAIHAGKRARTESTIGRHTTSVSHAAVQKILENCDAPAKMNVLIMGAGESAALAAGALRRAGVGDLGL
jgi:glutamyl-tRNA reductase